MRQWLKRFWGSKLWGLIVHPVYWLGRPLLVVGPWVAVVVMDDPPLWVGVMAALAGLGLITDIFVQGFYARSLAVGSAVPERGELATHSWALTIKNGVLV